MPLKRCENGHYYDPSKHTSCPSCGISELDSDKTVPRVPPRAPTPAGDDAKTVPLARKRAGIDPVVGWLVCTDGADRGKDHRLHSERNFIGRAAEMDVRIADETISRERHASISFNPKNRQFKLQPGEGRALIYLNDEEVDGPAVLSAGDRIEIGQTKLLFVPLCGESFSWD